jgi:hypothetical protein
VRIGIALSFAGLLGWGCGSPSGDSLFAHGAGKSCTAAVVCTGPGACSGHEACGEDGKLGPCTCDVVNQHQEAGVSTGGTTATSSGGSGGTSELDSGDDIGTGGSPLVDSGPVKVVDSSSPATCPVGSYSGKLSGIYKAAGSISQSDVGATITFSVDSNGAVTGTYSGPSSAKATLSGNLDCRTGALNVLVEKGTYTPPLSLPVDFSGTLTGTYDVLGGSFRDGKWKLTEPNDALDGGQGDWIET